MFFKNSLSFNNQKRKITVLFKMSKATTNSLSGLQSVCLICHLAVKLKWNLTALLKGCFVSLLLLRFGCDLPGCLRLMPLGSNSPLSKYFGTFKEQWDWIKLSSPGDMTRKQRETTYRCTCLLNRMRYTKMSRPKTAPCCLLFQLQTLWARFGAFLYH